VKRQYAKQLSWIKALALSSCIFAVCLPANTEQGNIVSKLSIACFDMDATPPPGEQLAYDPCIGTWDMSLRARGIIILGANDPIVLCSLDWIGIGNDAHDAFRSTLAQAVSTTPDRVAVHTVHQHDAPGCDFSAENILREYGVDPKRYAGDFTRDVLTRLGETAHAAVNHAQPLTHLGLGAAPVHEVASNRRILDESGKVRYMRFTTCTDAAMRAEPEGVIDPEVSLVSLWNNDTPVAVLSYYACHPQSYYRTGIPNPDFPGVARFLRQLAVPSALHIHFAGAGGNLGAGKYNDGAKENRYILAQKLADGMKRAWENTQRTPVLPGDIAWSTVPVSLPPAPWLNRETLEQSLKTQEDPAAILGAATKLAWVRRCEAGVPLDIACLSLGRARILHMPGELFVEYQLAAKALRPDLFIAMAAYGNYGTGYIGTQHAYEEGGYETSDRASNVAPETEIILLDSIKRLLHP
jgi:hypothetical protein